MTLHIFNPEHDIALAFGADNFTAPHAARQLRTDLCWIPGIWAKDGDAVLVADGDTETYDRLLRRAIRPFQKSIQWVTDKQLASLVVDKVDPWGWDVAVASFLRRKGVDTALIPDKAQLDAIRQISSRHTALNLLSSLKEIIPQGVCGEMYIAKTLEEAVLLCAVLGECVIKSPWSSSGRGVRFVSGEMDASVLPWVRKTIDTQGSVMVERKENKVADFAMEFYSDGKGGVEYHGLSLFSTRGTAYTGNLLMPEEDKLEYLGKWINKDFIYCIQRTVKEILREITSSVYSGPLGVDMMVVSSSSSNGFFVHPCVEINLRRTMGMMALSLAELLQSDQQKLMQIRFDGNYHFVTTLASPQSLCN